MFYCPYTILGKVKRGQESSDGTEMTGEDARHVFEATLPKRDIERLCQQHCVIACQRRLNVRMLVRAMIISAGTPGGAR